MSYLGWQKFFSPYSPYYVDEKSILQCTTYHYNYFVGGISLLKKTREWIENGVVFWDVSLVGLLRTEEALAIGLQTN